MDYRFTDTNTATVTFDLTLGDVADLRATMQKVLSGDVSDVSSWQVRSFVRKLADAQRQAAEVMALDANALAEDAKIADE